MLTICCFVLYHQTIYGFLYESGKEKDEGSKIYTIAKQVAQLGLTFCCLQEVKYRNKGNKVVKLDTGEKFEYHWYGMKKRRTAGVGILIKCDRKVEIDDPDSEDPRLMCFNLKVQSSPANSTSQGERNSCRVSGGRVSGGEMKLV